MTKQTIIQTINEGVSFLKKTQQSDGSFASFSSSSQKKFSEDKLYRSAFPVALVLSCLNEIKNSPNLWTSDVQNKTKKLTDGAAKFLLGQKSEHWSFNYWVRDKEEAAKMPYPDDLDDTFCALAALSLHNPASIDAKALAKIISLLTFMEEKEGGPYRTWLVPADAPSVWKDVDLAVNSNVAYFLSLQEVSLPGIISFVEKAIDTEEYSSPYYPSLYPIIYFISRFYTGAKTEAVRNFLLKKQNRTGSFGNPLNTALAVSALLRLGTDPKKLEKSISYLMRTQKNGAWTADAFCLDPALGKKTYYAGSPALSTAFCIEALALCEKAVAKQNTVNSLHTKIKILHGSVVRRIKKKFAALDADLQKEALARLDKTLLGDKDGSIVLLPYFFKESLGKDSVKISSDLIEELCLANLYGWIAYTIYDDFLDDEGEPKLLSLANVCLRELTGIFLRTAQKNANFSKIFTQIMDKLDSANAWEIANCRTQNTRVVPEYGNLIRLAERSLGHALGPLAILCSLGHAHASPEVKNAKKFFEEYLIARQLNDDAHDWESDIKMGHINSVGTMLIKSLKKKTLPQSFSEKEAALMQEIFWSTTIDAVAAEILGRAKTARKYLHKVHSIKDFSLFEKLLAPIEGATKKALEEKEQTLAFLKAY